MDVPQIVVVVVAVSIGFFAKGITGIGGPLVAVPVLAAFMGVEYAVAVIAVPSLLANLWMLRAHRLSAGEVSHLMRKVLAAGAGGVVLGAWILVTIDERVLSLILALFVLAYIVWYTLNSEFRLGEVQARRLALPVGFVSGSLQGATGISAPVLGTYMHSLKLSRDAFIFAMTLPFLVLGIVQIGSMTAFGVYTGDRLVAAAFACVPMVAVLPVAMRLGSRLSGKGFEIAVLVVLGLAAIRLFWSVF